MHTSLLLVAVIAILASWVAVELVVHEGAGEDLRELALLKENLLRGHGASHNRHKFTLFASTT